MKLDEYANNIIIHRMERSGVLCAMASEENADLILVPDQFQRGDYILVFDPLDGSSNIDVNTNIGTIFSILRRQSASTRDVTLEDVFAKRRSAGGSRLFSLRHLNHARVHHRRRPVHGFTMDPSVGEFLLSHPNIQIPKQGKIFSVNMGYWDYWDEATRAVLQYFTSQGKCLGAAVFPTLHRLVGGGFPSHPCLRAAFSCIPWIIGIKRTPKENCGIYARRLPWPWLRNRPEDWPRTASAVSWISSPISCICARRFSSVPKMTYARFRKFIANILE